MDDPSPVPAPPAVPGPPAPRIPGVEDLEPIGRGGYSTVYRGRQPDLGRDVAVKVLSASVEDGADEEGWRREITAMGRLSNHPNIVAAYAGGLTDDGRLYLVMPYAPEGSLGDRVRRSGPLPPAEVAALGAQLAGALASAHEAGVLHRDVKPDNVLLSPYGQPQLTDFGIARLLDATTTMTRTIHATVAYAAPEVLMGRPATEAADVYGLGATLFACLAGAPPFPSTEHDNVVSVVARITTQPPPDLRDLGVPDPLAAVIRDALAKSPAERIPSAEDLWARLEGAATVLEGSHDDTPPLAPPVAVLAARDQQLRGIVPVAVRNRHQAVQVHRPARRRGTTVAVAAALAVAVLVGIAFLVARDDGGDADSATVDVPGTSGVTTATEPGDGEVAAAASTENDDAAMAATAEQYFEAIEAGDFDASYGMLTPAFRQEQSSAEYEGYWGSVTVQEVGDVDVDADRRTAVVPVILDGRRQDFTLRFVQADDGTWMVDGPRPGEG